MCMSRSCAIDFIRFGRQWTYFKALLCDCASVVVFTFHFNSNWSVLIVYTHTHSITYSHTHTRHDSDAWNFYRISDSVVFATDNEVDEKIHHVLRTILRNHRQQQFLKANTMRLHTYTYLPTTVGRARMHTNGHISLLCTCRFSFLVSFSISFFSLSLCFGFYRRTNTHRESRIALAKIYQNPCDKVWEVH